jgi:hypothetical protein
MSRDKLIKTPEELRELFYSYREWVTKNPYKVHDFVGKDALEVERKKQRPVTWIGFEAWLDREGIISQLTHYEQNDRNSYTEYLPIIRAIKKQCSSEIIDGALAGIYNQNITARLEGLREESNINVNDSRKAVADLFPFKDESKQEEE